MKITVADIVLTILLLVLSAAISFSAIRHGEGRKAVIFVDNDRYAVIQIGEEKELTIKTANGEAEVVSDQEGIRISESSCPHQHCVKMGKISIVGQVIICVPNHIMIKVEGDGDDAVDGVVG